MQCVMVLRLHANIYTTRSTPKHFDIKYREVKLLKIIIYNYNKKLFLQRSYRALYTHLEISCVAQFCNFQKWNTFVFLGTEQGLFGVYFRYVSRVCFWQTSALKDARKRDARKQETVYRGISLCHKDTYPILRQAIYFKYLYTIFIV